MAFFRCFQCLLMYALESVTMKAGMEKETAMEKKEKVYAAIDLKSFYASVECVERGLDPLSAHLVVADPARTSKTICLAVSPALKAQGIPGRPRLFEVEQLVKERNALRRERAPGKQLTGETLHGGWLKKDPTLAIAYVTAPPRMALYMDYSARIYQIYLRYIAPEDIHVYSVDEVMLDLTEYPAVHKLSAQNLVSVMLQAVLEETGITAVAGMGPNLYLAKVAMDIEAKHIAPDARGMRIAWLDEQSYREKLWNHRPITDFWRVGRGYAARLAEHGLYTMGDVARCSLGKPDEFYREELLFHLFGVQAELLIDHAWGLESCTMRDIKAYQPEQHSLGAGQVLQTPYTADQAVLVVKEMADQLALDLVKQGLVTDQLTLTIGYDVENVKEETALPDCQLHVDHYGRKVPKASHGTGHLPEYTASGQKIISCVLGIFEQIIQKSYTVRRIQLTACHVMEEKTAVPEWEQLCLFKQERADSGESMDPEKEKRMQQAVLHIREKYGSNGILKGMNLEKGATGRTRNRQIGGHKA